MSRTHARRPADEAARRAPRAPDARKRALYSFKRIGGVITTCDDPDPDPIAPAQVG